MKQHFNYWIKINVVISGLIALVLVLGRTWFFKNDDWMFWVLVLIVQLHLTEEFLFPNKFMHWLNIHVCKSEVKHKPLTKKFALALNTLAPVPFIIMALVGSNMHGWFIVLPLSGIWMMFHNAWFHLTFTILHKGTLGIFTSILLIIPFTFYSIYKLYTQQSIGIEEVIFSFILGGIFNYTLFLVLRARQARFKKRAIAH